MKLAVRRTSTAVAVFATVGVSSVFVGVAPAAAATEACGATGTLVGPGVCEQVFTAGSGTFTPTAQMTKLEVLLVGAGGAGADQSAPNTNGYAAGGGGGEVRLVDFSDTTTPLDYTVATALTPGVGGDPDVPGATGLVTNNVDPDESVFSGSTASLNAQDGGTSGSGFDGALGDSTTPYGAGGGAAASPTDNSTGGAGVTVSAIAPSGSLFTGDSRCFGGGGAVSTTTVFGTASCGGGYSTDGLTFTAAAANSGGGGVGLLAPPAGEARAGAKGADGVIVFRWTAATLSLSFAANGHGTAPATQSIVAGSTAVRPADPTATGYRFLGWYTDASLTTAADFSAPVNGSTTYFARWSGLLAPTGVDVTPAPLAAAAMLAGAGLLVLARRRKPRAS